MDLNLSIKRDDVLKTAGYLIAATTMRHDAMRNNAKARLIEDDVFGLLGWEKIDAEGCEWYHPNVLPPRLDRALVLSWCQEVSDAYMKAVQDGRIK